MGEEAGNQEAPTAPGSQAVITLTVHGFEDTIVRRGAFEDLIGARSIEGILANFLDTDYLAHTLLQGSDAEGSAQRAWEEIASMLHGDFRVSVRRGQRGSGKSGRSDVPVPSPAEQKAADLATRVPPRAGSAPSYSLHLHISPGMLQPLPEQSYEERLALLKGELAPKVSALDFSGLLRGNRQAQADTRRKR